MHVKKQARRKSFYERQLERKENVTQQLRVELDETKLKLTDLVREHKSAGRQLLLDKVDVDTQRARLSQTMARQVSKMTHLWKSVRDIKAQSKAKSLKHDAGLQAIKVRLAHVGARKSLALKQKREATKSLVRQLRLVHKIEGATIAHEPGEDNPIPQAWHPIRHFQRNKGITGEFEAFARTIVATGCSGRHGRHTLLLSADYLLPVDEAQMFKKELPSANWFATQREAVGNESFVYACLEIAACDHVLQWGFDETSLDGQATFNQWCLVQRNDEVRVVILECAGILPSSTAEETITHIQKTWERGREVVQMVRDALGPELQDKLAPQTDGGLRLHKIFGLMHDTCATANLVAELMAKLRDDQGREYHGGDVWDGKDNKAKPMFDFLCGNHTRNLLTVRFEKRHDAYLEEELGEAMRAARTASGGRARLECSGTHFLRSLCKLTHKGYGQYVKGDGDAFADFLAKNYVGITNDCLSRADFSNRQDWSLEVSFELFPLLEPLLDYEVKSLLDEPNILRDSVLMQLECLYFEAYVHVGAIMWRVVFRELRGLTNSKGLELNPLDLNRLYESMYDLGKHLQTDKCTTVAAYLSEPRSI